MLRASRESYAGVHNHRRNNFQQAAETRKYFQRFAESDLRFQQIAESCRQHFVVRRTTDRMHHGSWLHVPYMHILL
jgi:hypothetical protein